MPELTVTYCPSTRDELNACNVDLCPCCRGLGVAARCPGCHGAGAVMTRTQREAELAHVSRFERCTECNGAGWFPITEALAQRLGFTRPTALEYVYRKPPKRA